jgi:hypothetical protein
MSRIVFEFIVVVVICVTLIRGRSRIWKMRVQRHVGYESQKVYNVDQPIILKTAVTHIQRVGYIDNSQLITQLDGSISANKMVCMNHLCKCGSDKLSSRFTIRKPL